jgi:hypothetical protein
MVLANLWPCFRPDARTGPEAGLGRAARDAHDHREWPALVGIEEPGRAPRLPVSILMLSARRHHSFARAPAMTICIGDGQKHTPVVGLAVAQLLPPRQSRGPSYVRSESIH